MRFFSSSGLSSGSTFISAEQQGHYILRDRHNDNGNLRQPLPRF
jgi:hypothetical protein